MIILYVLRLAYSFYQIRLSCLATERTPVKWGKRLKTPFIYSNLNNLNDHKRLRTVYRSSLILTVHVIDPFLTLLRIVWHTI